MPQALRDRIQHLSAHHDTALNWDDPMAPGPWSRSDYTAFCTQVRALRAEIAEVLGPAFEVVTDQFDCTG